MTTDLSKTIAPKSDQLNADDLIAGPRTIRITRVSADPSSAEQPVSIFFEGDGGKPWKPCKSMRRVLVALWGADGSKYPGRLVRIYLDPKVKWGGIEVGGVRISHLSHIERDVSVALTETRGRKAPFLVRMLNEPSPVADKPPAAQKPAGDLDETLELIREWRGSRKDLTSELAKFSWTDDDRSRLLEALADMDSE